MSNLNKIQWNYKKGDKSNSDVTVIKCNPKRVHSDNYLDLAPMLYQIQKGINTEPRFSQDSSKKNHEKTYTIKFFNPRKTKIEGQDMNQNLYKSICMNHIDSKQQQSSEQIFGQLTSELKLKQQIEQKIDEDNILNDYALQLRLSPSFVDQIQGLKNFNQFRRERVQNIDFDILFFGEIQASKDSESTIGYKCSDLIEQYPIIRTIRGDGNCLYSSIIYPYLEYMIMFDDWSVIDSISSNQLKIYDIIDPQNQQNILIKSEISRPLILQFLCSLRNAKLRIKQITQDQALQFYHITQQLFVNANETNGLYDLMIVFMRSIALTSFELNKSAPQFLDFICEGTQDELFQCIQTFETEADYLIISLICEILPIQINIIQWEDTNPMSSIQVIQSQNQKNKFQINLKYAPEHYDIVYQINIFKQWFIYDLDLEYLQEGYCCICQNFVNDHLIRLKKCSHTFCFQVNHLQLPQQKDQFIGCQIVNCQTLMDRKILYQFLQLRDKQLLKEPLFTFHPLF